MASLTETAIMTRKIIRYGIFAVIFLIIAKFIFDIAVGTYKRIFPAPPPPPTVSFGPLPSLTFPEKESKQYTFALDTPEGGLPVLPSQAKVFFMPKVSPTLLSLDAAKEKAENLGFEADGQQKSETIYAFPHKSASATLQINIVTGIFSISYDLAADSSPIEKIPPGGEVASAMVRSYLSTADLLADDLSGPASYSFLKIENGALTQALGQADANLVKVNLFRKNYDDLPSLPENPDEANVWFMATGSQERDKQIVAAEYHYFPVDESKFATYPLKSVETAWQELNALNGFIANPGTGTGENIIIRRVYLGYYDSKTPSEFYQPVFVFEGDNGFTAYVPAVTPDYYGK